MTYAIEIADGGRHLINITSIGRVAVINEYHISNSNRRQPSQLTIRKCLATGAIAYNGLIDHS